MRFLWERERFLCKIKKYFLCVTQNIWLEYRYSLGMGEVDFPYVPMTTIQWKFSSTGKTAFYRHMQRQWYWTNIQFAQIYLGVYWPSLHSLEVHKAQGPCSEELLADAFNFLSPVLSRSFRSRTSSSGLSFHSCLKLFLQRFLQLNEGSYHDQLTMLKL